MRVMTTATAELAALFHVRSACASCTRIRFTSAGSGWPTRMGAD